MKKRLSKSLLMTALVTGMCIGGVQGAFAADDLNTFALDEYVVTATRTMKQLKMLVYIIQMQVLSTKLSTQMWKTHSFVLVKVCWLTNTSQADVKRISKIRS